MRETPQEGKGENHMGVIILNLSILIEVAYACYCLSTKSYQFKTLSLLKIGSFTVFALLALTSVIELNLRWVLLGAMLLVRAVVGAVTLAINWKKDGSRNFKAARVVVRAAVRLAIISMALVPVLMASNGNPIAITGNYPVLTRDVTYQDAARDETFGSSSGSREVNVTFFYPQTDGGKFPLVVFSHGAFGFRSSNTSTMKDLASHGYVVCAVDHPYHALFTKDDKGKITMIDLGFYKEVMDTNKGGVYDEKTTLDIQHRWLKLRTDDLSFVLDTVENNAKAGDADEVYRLIDTERIGLIGHSLGGAADVQLARDRGDIDAVVNLDGDVLGEYLDYVNGEYVLNSKQFTTPLLNLYSDDLKKGFDRLKSTDEIYPQKLIAASDPFNFDVFLTGTNHLSLTDLPVAAPYMVTLISGQMQGKIGDQTADPVMVIETMNRLVIQFYDHFLKGTGDFKPAKTY
jgi:dienelactone hydrolase